MNGLRVVPVVERHRANWDRLYATYAAFYGVAQTAAMRDRVWSWIHEPLHAMEGKVAEDGAGRAVGLAHFRAFARPLSATTGGYLDDLFVDPDARGIGVADALIASIVEEGRRRRWSVLRWITAEDNSRARAVYDRVATATSWRTYDIPL